MERVYDNRVENLIDRINFGTLAILETIVKHSDDNPNVKKNYLLINGMTIVRNCYDSSKSDKEILNAISFDFGQLFHYFEMYAPPESRVIIFFNPGINNLIPEGSRKKLTNTRIEIARLTMLVASSEALRPNTITKLEHGGNLKHFGLLTTGMFAYRVLTQTIKQGITSTVPRIWLVSHCPLDFFLTDTFSNLEIIESHTGRILTKNDLSVKVFKDDSIPFNRITYKLFGDREFIRPILVNKPKAMGILDGIKLKLKTEREIAHLATNKLGIDPKVFNWDL